MKKRIFCLLFATASFVSLRAQTPSPSGTNSTPPQLNWQVTARDGMSTTRQAAELITNLITGATSTNIHQYIEVANGDNYFDTNGIWTESQDLITLTADGGAVALQGGWRGYFAPNLNVSNAITLTSAQNRVFQTRPAGIYFFDQSSGQRVLLASPQDCSGELLPPNVLDYAGAFGDLASMRYIATKAAFESDVIFTSRPKPPETYAGLNPATTTLEVWHEWLNAPVPQVNPHTLVSAANPDFALTDEILDFGGLWLPTGKAFSWEDESPRDTNVAAQISVYNPADDTNSIPVAKHWIAGTNGGSSWLIESVNWSDIQPKIASLPELSQADGPARPTNQTAFTFPPPAPRIPAHAHAPAVKVAGAKLQAPACVLDYVTIGTIATNYTFSNSWLYYIPTEGYFGAQVTFQPNCLIKYASNADLLLYGSVVCSGTTNSPSILTTVYDDTGIDKITGYGVIACPTIAATEVLWIYYITNSVTVSGMDIRWASRGVQFDDNGCGTVTNGIVNSIIQSSSTGVYVNNGHLTNQNLTLADITSLYQTNGCGTVAAVSSQTALADAIASGMEALTNGRSPSTAEYIFNTTGPTTNVTLTNMYFNTHSWVYGLRGLSACAAGLVNLTTNGTTNFTYPNGPNCTLITPMNALVAWHQGYTNGQNGGIYMFVGTNNVPYFGTVVGQVEVVTTNYNGLTTVSGTNGND